MLEIQPTAFVIAGGVAANKTIRIALQSLVEERHGIPFKAPPPSLCTDNAAMIAWTGMERFKRGLVNNLSFAPRPRWPLTEITSDHHIENRE